MRIVMFVLVVGCSSSNPVVHDGPIDGGDEVGSTCASLRSSLDAAFAMPGGSCTTANDCALVGGGGDQCESGQTILDCGGVAVETNAPGYAQILATLQQMETNGCTTDAPYDCAPSYATCEGGHCQTHQRSCLDPIPDASPDSGVIPDAAPATDAP